MPEKPADNIQYQLGELKGMQTAMVTQLSQITAQIVTLNGELDKKHEQNATLVEQRHAENTALIVGHKADDERNFAQVRKLQYMVIYGFAGAVFLAGVIWKVLELTQ